MPPSREPGRIPEGAALAAVLVLSLLLPVYWVLGPASRPAPAVDDGALAFADTAESYLRSGPAEVGTGAIVGDAASGGSRRDPFRFGGSAPRASGGGNGPAPAPDDGRWRVSAILAVNGEHVAIVNDVSVREGDRLPDGAEVISIGARRVVLRSPAGERVVLDF